MKGSATYKLIVPEKVEEKIRYLLRKFPSTEWSGVLFTSHQGTFENGDLVITCEDIYPMDLGNAVYTEFNMSEDVAAYMAEHIELFDCELQILHSHHQMSCTPSGTDLNTLREEGNERNCFVSLIVNNAGKYYAAITRKVQRKEKITRTSLGEFYEFFGEGSKELTKEGFSTTENVVNRTYIEYFDLEVERHEVQNSLSYLDARFDEIEKKKHNNNIPRQAKFGHKEDIINSNVGFLDWLHKDGRKTPKEPDLFEVPKFSQKETFNDEDEEMLKEVATWKPDAKKVHKAVVNMVTCNLIINPDKFDFKQWVTRHMVNVYKRIFGEGSLQEAANEACGAFTQWRDFIVQFTIDNFDVNDIPDELFSDGDLFQNRIAEAMINELHEFENPSNPYISAYCHSLELYLVE